MRLGFWGKSLWPPRKEAKLKRTILLLQTFCSDTLTFFLSICTTWCVFVFAWVSFDSHNVCFVLTDVSCFSVLVSAVCVFSYHLIANSKNTFNNCVCDPFNPYRFTGGLIPSRDFLHLVLYSWFIYSGEGKKENNRNIC